MTSVLLGRMTGALLAGVLLVQSAMAEAKPRKKRDVILAEETHGMPPGFHEEQRPRYGLIIGGAATTGLGGALFLTGLQGNGAEPLMFWGGACAVVGLPLLVYGLLSPRTVYVRNEPSSVAFTLSASQRDVGARVLVAF